MATISEFNLSTAATHYTALSMQARIPFLGLTYVFSVLMLGFAVGM